MSWPNTCTPPANSCDCSPSTAIPGASGLNAFTSVTQNFVVPAAGAQVTVQVVSNQWMVVGETVVIGQYQAANTGPGHFTVISIPNNNTTSVVLEFQNQTGDLAAGSTISIGAQVSPSGEQGVPGLNGYTQTTSSFILPSPGYPVTIAVLNTAEFVVNQNIVVGQNNAGGPVANFLVTAINSAASMTIEALGYTQDSPPGTTFPSSSTVTSAGSAGLNSFTTTTSQITLPAANQTILVNVTNNQMFAVGQNVFVGSSGAGGGGSFVVEAIPPGTTTEIYLTWLNYSGDLVTGSKIPTGAKVVPSAPQPSTLPTTGVLQIVQGSYSTIVASAASNLASSSAAPAYNATGVVALFSQSITPQNAASTIFYRLVLPVYAPNATFIFAGIYTATGTAAPIATAGVTSSSTSNVIDQMIIEGEFEVSSTSPITFYVAFGQNAGTATDAYVNAGASGATIFGGSKSTLTLTEYLS